MKIAATGEGDFVFLAATKDEVAMLLGYDSWWNYTYAKKASSSDEPKAGMTVDIAPYHRKIKALIEHGDRLRGTGAVISALGALLSDDWIKPVADILEPLKKP